MLVGEWVGECVCVCVHACVCALAAEKTRPNVSLSWEVYHVVKSRHLIAAGDLGTGP